MMTFNKAKANMQCKSLQVDLVHVSDNLHPPVTGCWLLEHGFWSKVRAAIHIVLGQVKPKKLPLGGMEC